MNPVDVILKNAVMLIVLIPIYLLFCCFLGGDYWWAWAIGLAFPAYFFYLCDKKAKEAKEAAKQAVIAHQRMLLEAQEELERRQRAADMQAAVEGALAQDRLKDLKRQWN